MHYCERIARGGRQQQKEFCVMFKRWSFLVVIAIFSVGHVRATAQLTAPLTETVERPFHQISADMKAFMIREARSQTNQEQAAAIEDLCALYEELKRDARVANSETLKGYKTKMWSRLTTFKKELIREIKRESPKAPLRGSSIARKETAPTHSATESPELPDVLTNQMIVFAQMAGGPMRLLGQNGAGFGGRPVQDYGPDLVTLIERTIQPDFWEVNGGPGRIYYYRPLHALVVTATSDMHVKIGGAFGALRAVD